jgi:hypothetical protein
LTLRASRRREAELCSGRAREKERDERSVTSLAAARSDERDATSRVNVRRRSIEQ